MKHDNKIYQPLYIIAITVIILITLSFIKFEYPFEKINFTIRNVDLFSDIKEETAVEPTSSLQYSTMRCTESSLAIFPFLHNNILELLAPAANSSNSSTNMLPLQGKKTPITGNTKQLFHFFDALKNSKTKTVRIAHYGDSAIEGDLITADIRETFQSKFGGNGVGWLGIVSQDITFRMTTKHSFSNNWESAALYTNNPKGLPLGISGEAVVPKGNAWVQYETTPFRRYLKDFSIAKLYYTNAKTSTITYSFDGRTKQTAALKPGSSIQELILKPTARAKSIRIEFPTVDQATFYGIVLENEPGLYVDNLPLRGNSGVDLQQLNSSILKDFANYLDYKLIILEFGLNIAGGKTDYLWYEKEMVKVINNFKAVFPQTSFVLISVHDKATKKGTGFVTDPTILRLVEAQKNIAKQADVAIWSLFDAMGGENSMPNWVNANPPLAYKDYIHFNDQGAKKVAQLFTEALIDEFNKYK